jgi:hypothetical protein
LPGLPGKPPSKQDRGPAGSRGAVKATKGIKMNDSITEKLKQQIVLSEYYTKHGGVLKNGRGNAIWRTAPDSESLHIDDSKGLWKYFAGTASWEKGGSIIDLCIAIHRGTISASEAIAELCKEYNIHNPSDFKKTRPAYTTWQDVDVTAADNALKQAEMDAYNLASVFEYMQDAELKKQTEAIRAEKDKGKRDWLKLHLPQIFFQGIFTYDPNGKEKRVVQSLTGIIALDFDDHYTITKDGESVSVPAPCPLAGQSWIERKV